jgi:NitT/TauT family transport system ATP-binding protein
VNSLSFLILRNISHTYFTPTSITPALEDINLEIEKGEFVSLIGPSGCGKTTLLTIISGLLSPTRGEVLIENEPVNHLTNSIGYMLQQDYLLPWKTIKDNILIGLKLKNDLNAEKEQQAIQLLHHIGLEGVENMFPRQLSGGMRQRVALVRTLVVDPKIFLLDEPFSALDYQAKLKLEDLVADTLKSFQKTAVLVTHDIQEAIGMSDRVVLLSPRPGRIHQIFNVPEEIRALPPFQARNHPKFHTMFHTIWKELENIGLPSG